MLLFVAGYVSMNAGTCQALIAFFPLVMVTLIVERRIISLKIRRLPWFRTVSVWVLTLAFCGLALALVGSQLGGLSAWWAIFGWLIVAFDVVGLAIVLLASMATTEAQEDGASAPGDAA